MEEGVDEGVDGAEFRLWHNPGLPFRMLDGAHRLCQFKLQRYFWLFRTATEQLANGNAELNAGHNVEMSTPGNNLDRPSTVQARPQPRYHLATAISQRAGGSSAGQRRGSVHGTPQATMVYSNSAAALQGLPRSYWTRESVSKRCCGGAET